jgi:plastocyanin
MDERMDISVIERRTSPRHPVPAGAHLVHPASARQFPARTENLSAGGAMVYVPATMPVQPGQKVTIKLDSVTHPELTHLSEKDLAATVVRVDRFALLETGNLALGVAFEA